MNAKTRREREREETRRKICDAARELFAQYGYEAVTMRNIAQRIEYTPTCIYFHFADKEALFRHICQEDFERFAEEMHPAVPISDPVARIRALGQMYLDFARRYPNHYRLLFMTDQPDLLDEQGAPVVEPPTEVWSSLVEACGRLVADGRAHRSFSDAETLARVFWAGVHGVASLQLVKSRRHTHYGFSADVVGTAMLDALQRGLFVCDASPASRAGPASGETDPIAA